LSQLQRLFPGLLGGGSIHWIDQRVLQCVQVAGEAAKRRNCGKKVTVLAKRLC
jgi:hypothetical protein